jgi:DNA-binding response OmpR family regulator
MGVPSPSSDSGDKKEKILLVEDDPMVVRMYKRKFGNEGFDLVVAFNGEEGLAALEKERPNLVLLDVMMPKMSGLDMLKAVKSEEKYKKLPVVMLTNLGDRSEDVEKCKELGAEDYWVKANMKLDDIVSKVRMILEKYSNERS